MKIFITGANGFIGSNLTRYFGGKGWQVYGLVRRTSDLHFLDGLNTEIVTGDLLDPGGFEIPPRIDYVVHLASMVSDLASEEACRRNVFDLAANLLVKLRSLSSPPQKLVFISTALVLGFEGTNISEERPGCGSSFLAYTRAKAGIEEIFREEWRTRGVPVVILRPGDVYGPNDRTSCVRMLRACERGVPLIVGHGNWRFGYCYIDNLCQAVDLALSKKGIEGKAYTITNGVLPTWRMFFSGLQKGLGRRQRVYVPVWLAFVLAAGEERLHKIRPGFDPEITRYRIKRITTETTYDISKTVAELGYAPDNRTDIQIDRIVSWYLGERARGFIR
jgi:nucleoside-diphosphate-sugar epimerase